MTFEPLVGNKEFEEAAVVYVTQLEIEAGRHPQDMRLSADFPGDISSPPRTIEIKAVGKNQRGWFVPLESSQYQAARADPNFYLYVVDNISQGDPLQFRLKVFSGDRLARLLQGAKRREYWSCRFRSRSLTMPQAQLRSPTSDAVVLRASSLK